MVVLRLTAHGENQPQNSPHGWELKDTHVCDDINYQVPRPRLPLHHLPHPHPHHLLTLSPPPPHPLRSTAAGRS